MARHFVVKTLNRAGWLALLLLFSARVSAGQSATSAAASGLTAYEAETAITVDGMLDEGPWQAAASATGFRQSSPNEGAPATQETEVRVVYGTSNVYIGATLYDDSPDDISTSLGRRDDVNRADWFFVSLDSYFDRKTAYVFGVNAGGVQYDGIRGGGGGGFFGRPDESWDAVWESDVRVTSEGWIVEMRIPYSMLRFTEAEAQRWGVHFSRQITRLGEESEWPLIPRAQRSNSIAQYAVLDGLTGVEPQRNIQVRPYTLSKLQTGEGDIPRSMDRQTSMDVGADVKIGITSGITLDATVNPDFGQVEVDPAVLNLTAFETFFQEKRPFFLEGSQIFQFNLDRGANLLYTRRIGARAPIIGAAKLSGRTAGGTSVGFLGATTGDNFSPTRHYSVARVSQEIGNYSSVGGIATGFLGPDRGVDRQSFSGGVDYDIRFLDNNYGISGFGVLARRGNAENGLEQSGTAGQFEAARRQGVWQYNLGVTYFSDDFNANDIGQVRRNNYVDLGGFIRHDINGGQAFGPFQRADVGIFGGQEWSYDERLNTGFGFRQFSNWTLRGFQRIQLRFGGQNLFGGFDLYETRGMDPWEGPAEYDLSVEFSTDDRRSWELQPEAEIARQSDGGGTYTVGFRSEWNVSTRVNLSAQLEYEAENDVTAWTSNEEFLRHDNQWMIGGPDHSRGSTDPGDYVAFDGSEVLSDLLGPGDHFRESIFGRRDTRALDFTLRTDLTFSPTLSIQFYGQMFMARGRYQDFQLLQNPESLADFDAYPKRDEFSFGRFTANTVLRWEYRPGSRLYLVWTQGRRANRSLNPLDPLGDSPYAASVGDQFSNTFDVFPDNVFLIKLDYTFLR
ncbi:MAG: DUF5916 domain-containing protein [Rhodothermales bacterium]